ncbi:MAG: glycogen synthase, partial [Chthoniobacterales bacterium]
VVVDGKTGLLVNIEQMTESPFEALHPIKFSKDLADNINKLMSDEPLRALFAKEGRRRVEEFFSWEAISGKVLDLYNHLLEERETHVH